MIELLEKDQFQPVEVYQAEKLTFDVPSNFQIANGQIIVGIKNKVVAIDLETKTHYVIYSQKETDMEFDVVAVAQMTFSQQLVLAASKKKRSPEDDGHIFAIIREVKI